MNENTYKKLSADHRAEADAGRGDDNDNGDTGREIIGKARCYACGLTAELVEDMDISTFETVLNCIPCTVITKQDVADQSRGEMG